jgi:ATP-dependent helicase Lhr and Lhr-like helicase
LLIESFPHEGREHMCVYGFAGRNAQQTLGLLLTKRMEEMALHPLGFVATDYATLIWGLEPISDPNPLFERDALRQGLDNWLASNAVMKRTFRASATIAGLIERNLPSNRKTGRQATFSSDILYDTLLKYDPDHLMLRITRTEAMRGLVDFGRLEDMVDRIRGRVDLERLDKASPLAAPMLLEVGKVPVSGAGEERLLAETADRLLLAAGLKPSISPDALETACFVATNGRANSI